VREENKDWDPVVFIDYEFAAYNYRHATVRYLVAKLLSKNYFKKSMYIKFGL